MKLLIATMFHNSAAGFTPYISSLVNTARILERAGVEFDYITHPGDSYVDRGRNTVCAKFLEGDYTDLLFIDSDMEWDPAAIGRIIVAPGDVVGGTYPMKNQWGTFPVGHITHPDGRPKGDPKTGLLEVEWVMMGFTKITRTCLEKMQEALKDTAYHDDTADPGAPDRTYYKFFETKLGVGGEDQTFCKNWRDIGGEIWLEPRITFGHYGVNGWHGNYSEFLMRQPGGIFDPAISVNNLQGKHQGETAWIVGKGPSIQNLKPDHFGEGPVITLNEALLVVEPMGLPNPVYSMQKDGGDIDTHVPEKATLLVHKHESATLFRDYSPRFMFDNIGDFGLPWNAVSLMSAVNVARVMGCSRMVIACCDSLTTGDGRTCLPVEEGFEISIPEHNQYSDCADGSINYLNAFPVPHEFITP